MRWLERVFHTQDRALIISNVINLLTILTALVGIVVEVVKLLS